MNRLKLNNPWMEIYVFSDNERFRVRKICSTTEEANQFCMSQDNTSVIATDNNGLIYIVDDKST